MKDRPKPPGRWKPGESGNPRGKPPGLGRIAKLREALAEHVPAIVEKLVEQARAGDTASARLVLERCVPTLRPTEQTEALALDGLTLSEKGRAVFGALAEGQIAPTQAAVLLASLADLGRLIEGDELSARIAVIESKLAENKGAEP